MSSSCAFRHKMLKYQFVNTFKLRQSQRQEKSEMLENFRWPLEFVHGTLRERSAQPRQTNGNKFSVYGHSDVLADWP